MQILADIVTDLENKIEIVFMSKRDAEVVANRHRKTLSGTTLPLDAEVIFIEPSERGGEENRELRIVVCYDSFLQDNE
jgi:hypothetical protein